MNRIVDNNSEFLYIFFWLQQNMTLEIIVINSFYSKANVWYYKVPFILKKGGWGKGPGVFGINTC